MRIISRFFELGLRGCSQALNRRIKRQIFRLYYPKQQISSFDTSFLEKIIESEEFANYLPQKFNDNSWVIKQANLAAAGCFNILGSGERCFKNIPWQKDFKAIELKSGCKSHWQDTPNIFYQDIHISCPDKIGSCQYNPDVKTPWELSRFQQIFILGKAYEISKKNNDLDSCARYKAAFENQVTDWILQNPFPYGVNWVCPMDVAIRAINLIWGSYFFKDISINSKNLLLESLLNHAKYLEWNWETSDKPNNHYISDLVGYLYLCILFNFKRSSWCIKKILEQFFHQVNTDGTCYEGSTAYHTLDTELFLHFKLICQTLKISLPAEFLSRFEKMVEFLKACTIPDGLVQIGDNDGGEILTGVAIKKDVYENYVKNYPDFGIAIINKSGWHITLRYNTFIKKQPSGHFHQDALSVTLCVDGTPILVDPGTYLYTGNSFWRNKMRSWNMHNTFNIFNSDKIEGDLFQLPIKQQAGFAQIRESKNLILINAIDQKSNHSIANRALEFDIKTKSLTIEDWWNVKSKINSEWNLIFNPELKLKKKKYFCWVIEREKNPLLEICSNLEFNLNSGVYSKSYGLISVCPKLTSTKFVLNEKQKIILRQLT